MNSIHSANSNTALTSEINTSQIPTDSLESIRNRLNQVHLSLRKLSDQINHHNRHPNKVKLPNYAQFQNQFQVLLTQLHTITSDLENNDELLKNTNVYPLPSFPTTQQEGLITTLLRKKPLPEVDEWIESAIDKRKNEYVNVQKDDEFAQWCLTKIEELREDFQFYGFNSVEELKYLDSEDGKKETEENKKIENQKYEEELKITDGGKSGLHPNRVLKFMCQGVLT